MIDHPKIRIPYSIQRGITCFFIWRVFYSPH